MVYHLRVNISKDQSRYKQGSTNRTDFHIYCSVFHADSHGAIRFSKMVKNKKSCLYRLIRSILTKFAIFKGAWLRSQKRRDLKCIFFGISVWSSITLYGLFLDSRNFFQMQTVVRVLPRMPLNSPPENLFNFSRFSWTYHNFWTDLRFVFYAPEFTILSEQLSFKLIFQALFLVKLYIRG